VIRVAAVGDVHFGDDSAGRLRPHLDAAAGRIDLLLLAGDLTRRGLAAEARLLAAELRDLPLPVIAVLGNHDYHQGAEREIARILTDVGVRVLEGESTLVRLDGATVGVAGVKGFGGGFAGACATEFGEREMKAFAASGRQAAAALRAALEGLVCDLRVALLHYSPVEATLVGEPPAMWPFLGSYLLAEALDTVGPVLAVHGHAHAGSAEAAHTPGGVPVRNVAQPVIRRAFAVIEVGGREPGVAAGIARGARPADPAGSGS